MPAREINRFCKDCNLTCTTIECYRLHKLVPLGKSNKQDILNKSQCQRFIQCPKCKVVLERSKRNLDVHICAEWLCKYCEEYVHSDEHYCFSRIPKPKENVKQFIHFDFECSQDTGEHIPNFAVAHTTCEMCMDDVFIKMSKCISCGTRCSICNQRSRKGEYVKEPCNSCSFREILFEGPDTGTTFCEWLFDESHKHYTVMDHNSKAYAIFLLHFLIHNKTRRQIIPHVIYRGCNILSLRVDVYDMKIIDSMSFLSTGLSKIPEMFGLNELCKGYFPHYFNTNENFTYVGVYPNKEHYGYDFMRSEDRQEFIIWHDDKISRNVVFNFRKEIEEYCRSDVDILRRATLKFRDLIMKNTQDLNGIGIDPFRFITIASACMKIYMAKFMTEHWEILTLEEKEKGNLESRPPTWLKAVLLGNELLVERSNEMIPVSDISDIVEKRFINSPLAVIPPQFGLLEFNVSLSQ